MKLVKSTLIILSILSIGISMQAQGPGIPEETMANITKTLDLSEEQQGQMSELMSKYRGSIDFILLKYEGQAEPDVGAMIGEIRKERDGYRKELATVLSPNQYDTYMAQINGILTDMFNDLAEIRLIEIQPTVNLTDKQLADLTPIIGRSMMNTVQLLFENAGEKLTLPKKVKIKNSLSHIEKEKRDGMTAILTPAQLSAYDQYKEEQKAARKG